MKALSTDLCNNILARGKKEKIPITPVKLQKLMYYTCREYVRLSGSMPIDENFEAWPYGPVLRSVYNEFCCYHGDPIRSYSKDARGNSYQADESKDPILRQALDKVWSDMKDIPGFYLSQMTHRPGSAWSIARASGRKIIYIDDIRCDNT